MNRKQQINKIVEVLRDSPSVEGIEGFEEVTFHFESQEDCIATPELLDPFRTQLFRKISNMVIFNRKNDVLSGMGGRWDASRLERGFVFGGGGIEMADLYPEKNFKYKFLAWVR